MKVEVLSFTAELRNVLLGLGLSHGLTSGMTIRDLMKNEVLYSRLLNLAANLAHKQGGHNKFLESLHMTLDIIAPRYWWQEFDTYRVGITKQSESTMHTMMSRELTEDDFEGRVTYYVIDELNAIREDYIKAKEEGYTERAHMHFMRMKRILPEGLLQRRIVVANYKTLQNMYYQRRTHRLPEWQMFFNEIKAKFKSSALLSIHNHFIFGYECHEAQ